MSVWKYTGTGEGLSALPERTDTPCVYALQFRDRCKVGITTSPRSRLKSIRATHRQIAGNTLVFFSISEPTQHARAIEAEVLKALARYRLPGEYLGVSYDLLIDAVEAGLAIARAPAVSIALPPSAWLPSVQKSSNKRYSHMVIWSDPSAPATGCGRAKRITKYFKTEDAANAAAAALRQDICAGPQFDRVSDVIAAVSLLGNRRVRLEALVERYLKER